MQESKQKVWFDINGNGRQELVEWVGASEAILALDLNNNGKIDSGRELFGNATYFTGTANTADNGFIALAQYDENRDGLISAKDRIFPKLKLWQDKNANGISEPSELKDLMKTSIVKINVTYAKARIRTGAASEIRQVATYSLSNGKTYLIGDIHFYPQPELAQFKVRKTN